MIRTNWNWTEIMCFITWLGHESLHHYRFCRCCCCSDGLLFKVCDTILLEHWTVDDGFVHGGHDAIIKTIGIEVVHWFHQFETHIVLAVHGLLFIVSFKRIGQWFWCQQSSRCTTDCQFRLSISFNNRRFFFRCSFKPIFWYLIFRPVFLINFLHSFNSFLSTLHAI